MRHDVNASDMAGEVLTDIDVDESQGKVLLTTASGKRFMFHHEQDCCESVSIVGVDGEWTKLIGKVLRQVEHDEIQSGDPPPECPDSWTRTNVTFRVDDATVICRWLGESNGYYSEGISVKQLPGAQQ